MSDKWINVFETIIHNKTLKSIVNFTLSCASHLNGDSSLKCFDITELTKVFELKSSEDSSKVLYHYILKYAFGFCNIQNLADLYSKGALVLFTDDELNQFRFCLRENIDCIFSKHRELLSVYDFVKINA